MKAKQFFLVFLSCTLILLSCGKKLPPEFKSLEGTWVNQEVYMKISEDGSFAYKRQTNGEKVSIDTWITEYSDKGFKVSVIFGNTDFVLDRKPYFDDSTKTTQMIVDGRMLVKQDTW